MVHQPGRNTTKVVLRTEQLCQELCIKQQKPLWPRIQCLFLVSATIYHSFVSYIVYHVRSLSCTQCHPHHHNILYSTSHIHEGTDITHKQPDNSQKGLQSTLYEISQVFWHKNLTPRTMKFREFVYMK